MRWTLKPKPDSTKVKKLQQELQVDPIVATLLVERGIETFDERFAQSVLDERHG